METLKDGELSLEEAVQLGAVDTSFFGQFFFPKAIRMAPPKFHRELDDALDNPSNRFVSAKIFRGGAKTTKFRVFAAKRISYAVSNTLLMVGKSQEHAIKSVEWLMRAVEYNRLWAQTFNLRKGSKWTSSDLEIIHGVDEYPIRVLAFGITGSIRGVNIDDYRPDFILVDDPCDEENTATPEGRTKMAELFFGALANSLAPASENPNAMMALAQTVLNPDDLVSMCERDPSWYSLDYGCFDEMGNSRWPERWSTEELLMMKESYIARGQLPLWMREMESRIISSETSAFLERFLKYYEILPEGGVTYMGVDPTPPPKESGAIRVNSKLDDAAIVVIKVHDGKVYLCDYYITKSPDPQEFISKIFELATIYNPVQVGIETFLFQRMLKTEIEREMTRRRQYFSCIPIEDRRKKETRIRQAIGSRLARGDIRVSRTQSEFIQQLLSYPDVNHDDLLDAFAISLTLINPAMEGVVLEGDYSVIDERDIPELEEWRGVP